MNDDDLGIALQNLINNPDSKQDWNKFIPIPLCISRFISKNYNDAIAPHESVEDVWSDILIKLPEKLKGLTIQKNGTVGLCKWFWGSFLKQELLDMIKKNNAQQRDRKKTINISKLGNNKSGDIKDDSKIYSEPSDELNKVLSNLKKHKDLKNGFEIWELNACEKMSYDVIAVMHPKGNQDASKRANNLKQQVSAWKKKLAENPELAKVYQEINQEKIDIDQFEREFDDIPKLILPSDGFLGFMVQPNKTFGQEVRDILQKQYNVSKELAKVVDPKYIKKYEDLLLKLISNDTN